MVSIDKIVEQFVQNNKSHSLYPILIRDWDLIFGKLKDKVKLEKAYNDTIILGVSNSSWLHELNLLSNVLLTKINDHLKKPLVKKIILKIASKKELKKKIITDKITLKVIRFKENELKALDKLADKELAENMKNFLIKCKQH